VNIRRYLLACLFILNLLKKIFDTKISFKDSCYHILQIRKKYVYLRPIIFVVIDNRLDPCTRVGLLKKVNIMQSSELRLGNWIKKEIWYKKEIEYYQIKPSHFCNDKISSFLPIPITEEWLMKLGFEKGIIVMYIIFDENYQIQYSLNNNTFCLSFKGSYFKKLDVKYIHQLQNLYFALTQNELTL
jgi:hypothetical protein